MCLPPTSVALFPQLFQIKRKTQQIQLRGDIRPAPNQKTLEFSVAFQHAEGAFHLNGSVDPQNDTALCCNIFL